MFSDNLNRILHEQGMTHYRLAQITGITHSAMSLYRNAKRKPHFDNLKKIASALNVAVDELTQDKDKGETE